MPATLDALQADLYFAWNLTLEGLTAVTARQAAHQHVPWIAIPLLHLARPAFYTMPHQLHWLRDAARILTQTPMEREFLLARGFAPHNVAIVSPGVATTPPSDKIQDLGLAFSKSDNAPLVVTIGALGRDKGTLHLLAACRRLWESGFRLELALVGTMEPAIKRAITRLPASWQEYCHCLGRISEVEKWSLLAAADVLALPSRTESFGIVFLEAWLCRKPVIGARAGAIPDVVQHGKDGVLVEFGDVPGLADALRTLLTDPARAAQLGVQGYRKVQQCYTWDHQYAHLQEVMAEVQTEWYRMNVFSVQADSGDVEVIMHEVGKAVQRWEGGDALPLDLAWVQRREDRLLQDARQLRFLATLDGNAIVHSTRPRFGPWIIRFQQFVRRVTWWFLEPILQQIRAFQLHTAQVVEL